jgi:PAS domain-containing protein
MKAASRDIQHLPELVGARFNLLTDIEDRKRAEEALRAREHNLRLIVDCIPAFAWYACPDGNLEYLNRRILDYTGESMEDLVGFGFTKALHPGGVDQTIKAWLHSVQPASRVTLNTVCAGSITYIGGFGPRLSLCAMTGAARFAGMALPLTSKTGSTLSKPSARAYRISA